MMRFLARFQQIAVGVCLVGNISNQIFASDLLVTGWAPTANLQISESIPFWVGDDPIIGRLACPALTRLEPGIGSNTPLLLSALPIIEHQGASEIWKFTLRSGLRWWDGTEVTAQSLANWFNDNLRSIVFEKLIIGDIPEVKVEVTGPLSVTLAWKAHPVFGPYVISGISFTRLVNKKIQCAGLYTALKVVNGIDLTVNRGYSAKFDKIHVLERSGGAPNASASIDFSMAAKNSKITSNGVVSEGCERRLDTPLLTAIVWNPNSALASTPDLRAALTMAVPRGEILRTGSADIGALLSAPILRNHPGYNSKVLIKPFSLDASSKILEQAGFKQEHIGLPRVKNGMQGSTLKIARMNGGQSLIEKMVGDSFASLGVNIQFDEFTPSDGIFDGALISAFIPWPTQDLRRLGPIQGSHKGLPQRSSFPFQGVNDKSLDELLDSYSLSLTQLKPDFAILKKIHEKWFEIEPWTILMSHQYCVSSKRLTLPGKISSLDSDWFRHISVDK